MLTAMVIFPIMSTGILPTVRTRSRLPPSCREQKAPSQPPSVVPHPPTYHVLHAYGDLIVDAEATKEADNIRRVTLMQHFQLSHDLIAHSWLDVQHDHLGRRKRGREEGRCVTIQAFQFVIRHERCGQWRLIIRTEPLPPHILGQLCH